MSLKILLHESQKSPPCGSKIPLYGSQKFPRRGSKIPHVGEYPVFSELLRMGRRIMVYFQRQNMKVTITSFSYKRGLPEDKTGNGGGFVFDCRAMPNPYWDESLRGYTGRDKPIADFFAHHKDEVDCFLGAAETLVRQSIDEYLKDGREHLQVAFGCTGGQHRSVYFAERMAERLAGTDGVELEVTHAATQYWKVKGYKS